ncbi:MAG: type 4a pilus biogenesis protein PilO [Lacipirellulaceae bacterium]
MKRQPQSLIWTIHITGAVTAIVLVLVVWFGVYQPLNEQAVADEIRIGKLESLIAQPKTWQNVNVLLLDQHFTLSEAVAFANRHSAGGSQDDLFIREADKLAEDHQLEVLDWHLEADRDVERFTESRVRGSFRGSYESISRFLASVSQMPRIAKVLELSLDKGDKSGEYPVRITFALYSSGEANDTRMKGRAL